MEQQDNERVAKEAAGKAAAAWVDNGMLVGLGTGTTAAFFISHLSERCRQGLKIKAVATSKNSHEKAVALGIPLISPDEITHIDITVDGADEIDGQKQMIKGGGGALLREKIIASISHEMVVIIDESKLVDHLGKIPLPIEIVPFAYNATIYKLEHLGYRGSLRTTKNGPLFLTDNNHYIFDIALSKPIVDAEAVDRELRSVPGVMETGLFYRLAGRVIVGYKDGHVEIRK